MREEIAKLSKVPGVFGAMIVNREGELIAENLAQSLDQDAMRSIGERIAGVIFDPDFTENGEICFVFQKTAIDVLPVLSSLLVVYYDKTVEQPRLRLHLNVVMGTLKINKNYRWQLMS